MSAPGTERAEAGFTLLEVLAAFVIAALATLVLCQAGFSGAAESAAAARYEEAVARAQSRLAAVGRLGPLRPEIQSGDDGGGYHWQLRVTARQAGGGLALYAVQVTERFGNREVTLRTEMLGPPQP
jgi:general secretion pathway protein I